MLHLLKAGDRVKIWPAPGATVPKGPGHFEERSLSSREGSQTVLLHVPALRLADCGEEVEWSEFWVEMARSGCVLFSDPRKAYARCQHVRHPHEVASDGKTALESGPRSPAEAAHWRALRHDVRHPDEAPTPAESAK